MIVGCVKMGLVTGELFAVWAWVSGVLDVAEQATAVATTSTVSTLASVIASLTTAVIASTVVAGSVGGGVAVILDSGCGLGDFSIGFGIHCLEEAAE
jgi:hypothetical protein